MRSPRSTNSRLAPSSLSCSDPYHRCRHVAALSAWLSPAVVTEMPLSAPAALTALGTGAFRTKPEHSTHSGRTCVARSTTTRRSASSLSTAPSAHSTATAASGGAAISNPTPVPPATPATPAAPVVVAPLRVAPHLPRLRRGRVPHPRQPRRMRTTQSPTAHRNSYKTTTHTPPSPDSKS